MKKTSLIVVLIFSLIVSALSASAAFDFYGNTYYENGTVLVGVNVTIEVYNMSGMMDQEIDVVSVLSNSTGGFNLSAIAEATGEDEYIYQIIVVKYDNGYADYVGKSLPMLDIDMINSLGEMDFFLRPGVTINITAYNSTGGIEPFQYIFKDSKLGYPIGQYVGEPYLNNVLIDAAEGRNYSFILYFNETMPLQYELNNISDYTGNHISLEFNVSDVPTVVSGSVFLADENYSVEPDLDTLEFVGFILEPGNTIFEMSMLPYNMGLWGGGQGDEINATTGDFDITLIHPGNDLDIMMVFVGYDSFDDEDFITYQNITIGPEINISNISIPIYNASGESDYVFEVDDGNHNVTSLGVNFSLQNTTGGAIESAFVTATLDYSDLIGMDVKWVVDIQENEENLTETGKFSLPLIEGYDLKMEIFSNEYAPKKTKIASSRYYSEPIVINLTEFDPGVIDGNLNDSDIYLDMLKYSDECNVPNYDRDACSLFPSNQSMENFNPFKLVLGGAKMNFVIGNKINGMEVVYLDVDLLASGPPDALFDAGADSNQTGDEITEAWTFAGNGPEIYEEVLIAVPFDQDFDPETINFSMPLLYDENLDVVWNASVNDTGDLPEEYEDFPEELFNGTMCDPSNLSATCYVNSTEFMAWFKMPHFSGGEAQFSGSEQVDITFTKTRVGASQINNGSKVTFILNVTNTGSDNLTDYSIFDEYNGTLLDFNNETSLNYTDYNATESNIEWTFNLSAGASQVIEVNFTAIAVGNATNFAEFQNSTEHTFANASATVEIVLAPSIVFTKTLVSDYQVINERKVILNGSKVTFILNVTNNGAENLTDYSIFDEYNYSGSFFNFNEEVSLNYSDYNESEDYIEWTFNLSAGSSQVIEINFTAIAVGNATNFAEFQNSTEHTFANASATVEIIIDSTPPTWNEDPQGSTIQYNTLFIYDVNASDNYQIDDYFINDTGNFSIGSEDGVITNNTLLALGVYYLNVSVNDTSNNVNSTIIAITVEDTIPPEWNETPQNLIIQYAASFSYQVNASDNNAIDKYFIDDDGNFTIVANTGVITNHTLLSMGVYSLNISVNDTSNHITSTIITITVQDLVYPTWNQTPANQVVEYNTSFSYQVNASDNNEVDKYFIDDETNFAIDSNSGIITNYTLLGIGIYSLNISVNDTSNNINSTVINITVQDTTYPAWDETPQSSTIQYGASFMYDVNATDALLDQYFVNDSTNFNIAGNGIITNAT
ncbi:MAG: hypothetical protein U9R34_06225, partial [Nanoarchaeota archaeon]|nr:hypothetical protein [Nanoarchaeota archaeon]